MGYYYYFHFMENDEAEKNQMSCSGYRSEDQTQAITEHRATVWVGGTLWPNLPQTGQSCELDSEHPPSEYITAQREGTTVATGMN